MPTISVIVPVYKVEPYLRRCVDSILNQTFTDFELLLVDDGSPDRCGEICNEYAEKDDRVRVFHQENRGQAAARNLALDWVYANSDSEYIAFVDSDDWVHPRYLELLLDGCRRFDVNICQCGHVETDAIAVFSDLDGSALCITPEEQYIHHYSAFLWDKFFSRACWEKLRFPEGQIYEDVAVLYKILFKETKIAWIEESLYYYFVNANSTVRKEWTPAKLAQIDAWNDQVRFFADSDNKELLTVVFKKNLDVILNQIREIDQTKLPFHEKAHYKHQLKSRIRTVLRKYGPQLKSAGVFSWYLSWGYPVCSWLYWTVIGLRKALKKRLCK